MSELLPAVDKAAPEAETVREDGAVEAITGQWYWVRDEEPDDDEEEEEDDGSDICFQPKPKRKRAAVTENIACVTEVGSNYAEVTYVNEQSERIHLDEFGKRCRPEHNVQPVLTAEVDRARTDVNVLMAEVKAVTTRLGVSPRVGIAHRAEGQSYAMATLAQSPDPKEYETALVRAKDKELPALFNEIKKANGRLAMWLKAEALPLQATVDGLQGHLELINDRIFSVSLYAGLTEQVALVREGEPAGFDEKLYLMQRRLYMDEECLLDYKTGGMEFKQIGTFDQWMAKRENMERLLPFPRCLVAMRVRRTNKERIAGCALSSYIKFELEKSDKRTFFYIRNGDRLYRMETDLEFGTLIFPAKDAIPDEPLMVKRSTVENSYSEKDVEFMSVREWESRVATEAERAKLDAAWQAAHPFKEWKARPENRDRSRWNWESDNPHHKESYNRFRADEWAPFDPSYVHFDECSKDVADRIKHYNRIVLIIQGLFDRSEVFHPHPPVKTWTGPGFAAAIELIYDGAGILFDGEAPDFLAYRAEINKKITRQSVLYGQDDAFARAEGVKESARRRSDYRLGDRRYDGVDRYRPYGNPGPGELALPSTIAKRAERATFSWHRERQKDTGYPGERRGDGIITRITVPFDELFNVSAYKPGDFLRFFRDPRTRAIYLRWAPMMLTAEEYHAGNLKPQQPV